MVHRRRKAFVTYLRASPTAGKPTKLGRRAWALENCGANVRFGSLADMTPSDRDVRFTPNSGHSSVQLECPKSAMCGRLLVGKSKLHVALLVGAAMCSAC
jgi:hypothetical protein